MHEYKPLSHSLKISSESDIKIMQIQILLAKQLRRKISKKKVISTALKALEEKMGIIAEGKGSNDEK